MTSKDKAERLAAQLRENLKRRKEQGRATEKAKDEFARPERSDEGA
jgi:hypothetical protein